jgi:hypothetical protein
MVASAAIAKVRIRTNLIIVVLRWFLQALGGEPHGRPLCRCQYMAVFNPGSNDWLEAEL